MDSQTLNKHSKPSIFSKFYHLLDEDKDINLGKPYN